MKPFSLLLALLFAYGFGYAQKPLTNSRNSSVYTYLYPVKDADMRAFYGEQWPRPDEWLLTGKPIDSSRTDKFVMPNLKPGNYLKVYVEENQLQYKLIELRSAYLHVLDNQKDFRFAVSDRAGNPISSADVYFNNRLLKYNAELQLYQTSRPGEDDVIKVVYQNVSNFYSIENRKGYYNNFKRKLRNAPVIRPILNTFNRLIHPGRFHRYKPSPYSGYVLFNKPKYKPNDTVKFKALILKKRDPVKLEKVYLSLNQNYRNDDAKIIGAVKRYRPGCFEGQFVLTDSLDLSLDTDYTLSLLSNDSKVDDDNTAKKARKNNRKLIEGRFKYEDYELKSIKFTARNDGKEASPGNPVALYYKAVDENDLPVPDGRIEISAITERVTFSGSKNMFVPDTLWKHNMPLDQVGETKVLLPDSIFPKADISFRVNTKFLNSNNESQYDSRTLEYDSSVQRISAKLNNDTLSIDYLVNGKSQKIAATVSGLTAADDTISKQNIQLPAKLLINASVAEYEIDTEAKTEYVELKDFSPDLSIQGSRTADSLFVKVNNPRNIPFWYTVFNGDKIVDGGKAIQLEYKKQWRHTGNAHFRINYIWGGEPRDSETMIEFADKLLSISSNQPVTVSPGQKVPIEVQVKDPKGRPLANADLSVAAVTAKFKNWGAPSIPYFGKSYPRRKLLPGFALDDKNQTGGWALNWKRWSLEMGLDSISYFQFTHPREIYRVVESAPDTITQVAPFVVKDGDILPIHILYIDEKPVYFNQAAQLKRYSFAVTPGKHNLKFRTLKQLITVDTVMVEKGRKLILSVNADTVVNRRAGFKKMTDSLSTYEAGLINKYLIGVVNNFGSRMATLKSDDKLMLINPNPVAIGRYGSDNNVLVGPLANSTVELKVRNEPARWFEAEPGYNFEFLPGLIKQKSYATRYPFYTKLRMVDKSSESYKQYALTPKAVDTLWQNYLDQRSHNDYLFSNGYNTPQNPGRLEVGRGDYKLPLPFIKNIIVYKNDDPDFIQVYPGKTTTLGFFSAGKYRIVYLLRGNRYVIDEDVNIKPKGVTYRPIPQSGYKVADKVSEAIARIIEERQGFNGAITGDPDRERLKEAFNEKYLDQSILTGEMGGQVVSATDKLPIPGVSVKLKGAGIGAVTDMHGFFKLKVPNSGKLVISFVGYESTEVAINPGAHVTIRLKESANALNEVVVVGYGASAKRSSLAYASSTILSGRVGGVNLVLRGNRSTVNAKSAPLYVIDGVIAPSGLAGISPENIADISILKDAAATALYGADAANGVIVITTRKGLKSKNAAGADGVPDQPQTLRSNFSDYAIWQPKLKTDDNGIARFDATFPDDITNWSTLYVAVGSTYSGYAQGNIKSFKALSANLVGPQFAVKGDKLNVLGKVMNYAADAVTVNRMFSLNGKAVKQGQLDVKTSIIDTFTVNAETTDSLKWEYTIRKQNGYFDGERRSIPVYEAGIVETKGVFKNLEKDTSLTLKFDPALGKVTFRAEASPLPVLLDETERLRNYEYLCNEQLASKLKGLLVQKRIRAYLNEPFKWDKNIKDLIKKLQESRKPQGTWGWWKDTDEELWISLHAAEALLDAEQAGYPINLNKQKLIDYLTYQLSKYDGVNKLDAIKMLFKLNAKSDFKSLITTYEKQLSPKVKPSDYEKLKLRQLKQQAGITVKLDSLLKKPRHTMFGNTYWGDENYNFFDNATQLTLLAYQILKADGKHADLLARVRNYFLEQRKDGEWRNTYESSLILETILPDLLVNGTAPKPSEITLKGDKNETITKFPYTVELSANSTLNVSKTGSLPVYITAYQQFWNNKPEKVSKDFTVNTWFERNGNKITQLKGGEAITLQAEVTARADADFVMVEIPIPAGCSYDAKDQNYWGNEVHREYFKNKVSVFCRKLKQGKYNFTVKLMPRYGGEYHLNPAKAEMMYFPVFYGREGMKKVAIK